MRPLRKPFPSAGAPLITPRSPDRRTSDVVRVALQDTVGFYCSICEMPLYIGDFVTSKQTSSFYTAVTMAQWSDLLLACDFCRFHRSNDAPTLSDYLWPDVDATFAIDGSGPFQHVLREVRYEIVEENTEAVVESHVAPAGLIVANESSADAARAKRTIDLFQLNSPFYDAASNTVSITSDLIGIDRRLELRTEAWQLAAKSIDALRKVRSMTDAPQMWLATVQLVASLAQATGFWSVWMTALWKAFGDRQLLRDTLLDVERRDGYVLTGFQTHPDGGKPPWLIFPGTDLDRVSL